MFLEIVEGVSDGLMVVIIIVGALILLLSLVGVVVQIYLMASYVKYNRRENSIGKTGEEVARLILDNHDLEKIKVSATGSLLFGNSYSHYFKKVRLRRLTYKKKSVTSLAMACQKSSLAVLDKENDPAMKTRIVLTPIVFFGPISVVPIVIIGVLFDLLVFHTEGICTIIASIVGASIFLASFVLQIFMIKTEKVAQNRALELMKNDKLANDEEIEICKHLFKLYNIEYINNLILQLLELVWRILMIFLRSQQNFSTSNNK